MIVIGASLGGTRALHTVLSGLPPDWAEPVAVVIHRHRDSDSGLIEMLRESCAIAVEEACDKEPIRAGCVTLAPADYHLLVEPTHFSLSTDDWVQFARPSIDVLFESAADAFGPRVLGVILTGASADGSRGAAEIKRRGGRLIVQDPATAASPVMPAAALAAATADHICPLPQIAPLLIRLMGPVTT